MLELFLLTGCVGGLTLIIYGTMPTPIQPTQNKSLELLADGFAQDFVNTVLDDESFVDLLHSIAYDFVSENIPLDDDDMKYELGFMLIQRTKFSTQRGH